MKKAEFIGNVAASAELKKADADLVVSAVISEITKCLESGNSLTIDKLGTFSTYSRAERMGRNPRDGSEIKIPASIAVRFKPAKALKEAVN